MMMLLVTYVCQLWEGVECSFSTIWVWLEGGASLAQVGDPVALSGVQDVMEKGGGWGSSFSRQLLRVKCGGPSGMVSVPRPGARSPATPLC